MEIGRGRSVGREEIGKREQGREEGRREAGREAGREGGISELVSNPNITRSTVRMNRAKMQGNARNVEGGKRLNCTGNLRGGEMTRRMSMQPIEGK